MFIPRLYLPSNIKRNKADNALITGSSVRNEAISLLDWFGIDLLNGSSSLVLAQNGTWVSNGASTNIYNADGTLTADRTLTQNGNDLIFKNGTLIAGGEYKFVSSPTLIGVPFMGMTWEDSTDVIWTGVLDTGVGVIATMNYMDSNGFGGKIHAALTKAVLSFESGANVNKIPKIEVMANGITMDGDNINGPNTSWLADNGNGTGIPIADLDNSGDWTWNFYPNTRNDTGGSVPINFLYTNSSGEVKSAPINGGLFETEVNAVAGDSATINKLSGRFRKDTSGTTFTLTNNTIVGANTIVLLTQVGAAPDAAAVSWAVTCSPNTAVIEYIAAPNANMDMNFLIIN